MQTTKLEYFSFAQRDNYGHHWDISDGQKRVAVIRGDIGEYVLTVGEGLTKVVTYHKTVLGAMVHLTERFICDDRR
jgi:hypothetical protein